ncbi:E3 ubiquitin-protein ligase Topors-like [Aphis gossypii]|uniref:E3 ubiquitin-protein ligase Topors-like n=1 Tax=Aphis gossypii TaxID=80765 RepID=UPI00215936E0|nr:E3 ubiquitin-protein ligase Topors-like [Aphis gossypii]
MPFTGDSEDSDVVELSSDEESITPQTNRLPNPRDRSSSPVTNCSICLDGLTNKCYTDSCLHLFCFECLKQWSFSEPSCPLCKQRFNTIFHSFDDQGDHQIYNVPSRYLTEFILTRARETPSGADIALNATMDLLRMHVIRGSSYDSSSSGSNNGNDQYNVIGNFIRQLPTPHITIGQVLRVQVYSENAWALPLPDPFGHFRECDAAYFRNNPAQVYRLQPFIARDLIAIKKAAILAGDRTNISRINVIAVANMILQTVTSFDIREGFIVNSLIPLLHERTYHFCHEFYNFASSPYDMDDYDRNVRFTFEFETAPPLRENVSSDLSAFASPPPAIPLESPVTIVLDSDDEESQLQEVIIISDDSDDDMLINLMDTSSSDSDNSDFEILSFHPSGSLNSALVNQPSTSTGIRDLLDQPSTSTGIRDPLDQPSYMVRRNLKRRRLNERFDADSSSSDED